MSTWRASWILERLFPDSQFVRDARRQRARQAKTHTKRELLRLLQNRAAMSKLLSKPVRQGVADVLGILGVAKHPPRDFMNTVLACADNWGMAGTLCVAIDVLLGDADNVPAVLKHRLKQDSPVSWGRRRMKLADLIQKLKETDDHGTEARELQR